MGLLHVSSPDHLKYVCSYLLVHEGGEPLQVPSARQVRNDTPTSLKPGSHS